MPMILRAAFVLGVLVALVGCSSASTGNTGGTSSGNTGGTTGGTHCFNLDAGCSSQSGCGETRGSIQVYACQSGRCALQATRDASCTAVEPLVQVQANVDSTISSALIASFEVRALYPFRVDGSAVGCADVIHLGDFPDGGSPLEVDPALQFENIGAYPANAAGSSHTFSMNVTLVGQSKPIVLVQAYSGGNRDNHATGQRIAEGCVDGATAASSGQTINVSVSP
jgi:hypothetical protein